MVWCIFRPISSFKQPQTWPIKVRQSHCQASSIISCNTVAAKLRGFRIVLILAGHPAACPNVSYHLTAQHVSTKPKCSIKIEKSPTRSGIAQNFTRELGFPSRVVCYHLCRGSGESTENTAGFTFVPRSDYPLERLIKLLSQKQHCWLSYARRQMIQPVSWVADSRSRTVDAS